MKKILFAAGVCAALMAGVTVTAGESGAKAKELSVSFMYNNQRTPGSNQYAVWIENAQGELVKTLFVTQYTAKGRARGDEKPVRGYIFRPACVPMWVKAAKPDNMSDAQLDAISGATPSAGGVQTFVWDFKDAKGTAVPAGDYKFFVEANLRDKSTVVYTGSFSSSKTGKVTYTTEYSMPDNTDYRDMISDLTVEVK